MPSRQQRITRSINKYGADVTLTFKAKANAAVASDWPDPALPPTTPAAPLTRKVKAIMVPLFDNEGEDVVVQGKPTTERVNAFFLATQDLNEVELVAWQGGQYSIQSQDAYELTGQILAQSVILVRRSAAKLMPHA